MRIAVFAAALALLLTVPAAEAQQIVDPNFDPKVAAPAYSGEGPRVVIDEAHNNFHTAAGQYAPFAALLGADGYRVTAGTTAFDAQSLAAADVLVVANAKLADGAEADASAFTEEEIAAVEAWVRGGGSLLLIADHAPFGTAAAHLAARFGVTFGKGWVFEPGPGEQGGLVKWQIDFARGDDGLGAHPIREGRSPEEAVALVRSFTGQSMIGPEGSVILMRLPADAREAPDQARLDAVFAEVRKAGAKATFADAISVAGQAQGLAFTHGEGRVVMLGEAAMLSAQLRQFRPALKRPDLPMGMNVPGIDNRQFGLNILHWLSRAIE